MLKKIFVGIGITIGIAIITGFSEVYYFLPNEDKLVNFIADNPDKASILLIRNDTTLVSQNPNKLMPLASTVKIILAIEYAVQRAERTINPDQLVSINSLNKFYVPKTDGGAHSAWLNSIEDKIVDNKISIREVAKGMIKYSSNANTEWLLNTLGIDKVNKRLDSLGLKRHTEIYNIVSALFVGKELFPKLEGKALKKKLSQISQKEYINATEKIHQRLVADSLYKKNLGDLSMDIQKIWSDRLPASTTEEYVSIMEKINNRTYFNKKEKEYLDEVMEFMLENPANNKWLEHTGAKGGSTPFLLTKALYATDKNGNKTEMAYFLNNLTTLEFTTLRMSIAKFDYKVLSSNEFRERVQKKLPN